MREEAERVVEREGWTKAALGSMHKIDSFLRESQRLRGLAAGVYLPARLVLREFLTASWVCSCADAKGRC